MQYMFNYILQRIYKYLFNNKPITNGGLKVGQNYWKSLEAIASFINKTHSLAFCFSRSAHYA